MPSNIIIFEAEYIAELVSGMNSACELMSEAVQSLKQASLHEGWKCKECVRISGELDDLNVRLGRLDEGVNETARVLGGSVSRFASLEESYKTQAKGLSDELTQNHGYSGTVHTDSSSSGNGGSGRGGRSGGHVPGGGRGGEANSGSGHNGSGSLSGQGNASGRGTSSMASSAGGAGVIISGNVKTSSESESSSSSFTGAGAGYSSVSVNLPVTHIPDRPDAAAKGIKDTQEIADIAVSRVASTITETLNQNPGRLQTSAGAGMAAQSLVEAYNAGKSIVENSASIISSPTMPHTRERLAMAEGIVNLAGTSLFTSSNGNPSSGNITSGSVTSGSATSGSIMSENVRSNAGNLISAMNDVSGGGELRSVLSSFMSESSESSGNAGGISPFTFSGSSGGDKTFFDKIIEALRKTLSGNSESSSSGSSSPVDEFLKNLMTEQV